MIGIIDYGAGNLFSVKNALDYLGVENCVTGEKEEIEKADGLILPGVGAFPDAMDMLERKGLAEVICREASRKPLLGICLGMQLLFEKSSSKNFFVFPLCFLAMVELAIIQLGVEAALFQQGLVVALLDDVTVPHH